MEPITQGLLGAAVGQAACVPRLGRRALGWGALVGVLPDLDVLVAPLHGGFGEMLYHRGSTHSLWFGPVVGPLIGLALARWLDRSRDPALRRAWIWLCVLALFTHPLLDVFTTYGTQLFAPFDRTRFAWHGVAIIDPLYSALLAVAVVVGLFGRVTRRTRQRTALAALVLSTGYLAYGVWINERVEQTVRAGLGDGAAQAQVHVYPTLLQPWLRRVVVRLPSEADEPLGEVRVGLHTALRPTAGMWRSFRPPPRHPFVRELAASWEGRTFVWFAMDETTSRAYAWRGGTVAEIEDLRYGLPSPPDRGWWGIRALYDENGRRVGPVVRYAGARSVEAGDLLGGLWSATFGDFAPLEALLEK